MEALAIICLGIGCMLTAYHIGRIDRRADSLDRRVAELEKR